LKNDNKALSNIEFSKDAADYDHSRRYASLRAVYSKIVDEALSQPFKSLLDVGCGTGALMLMVQERLPNAKLFGIDISEEMIKVATAKLAAKADLRVSDSENLPFESGSFDLVLCTFSFHHHPNAEAVFKGFGNLLARNGRLIVADPLAPTPVRQVMNILIPFMKDGTVRYYSKREMYVLAESAGLSISKWATLNWHSYMMVAQKTPRF